MHYTATDGMNGRNWKQKIQGSSSSYTLWSWAYSVESMSFAHVFVRVTVGRNRKHKMSAHAQRGKRNPEEAPDSGMGTTGAPKPAEGTAIRRPHQRHHRLV